MKVKIYLKDASNYKVFENVLDTFQEGSMFCILYNNEDGNFVRQYPISNIHYVERTV